MPGVSGNQYNAQSLAQLMGSISQLINQQQQIRRDYTPQQSAGAGPQTAFQGLAAGLIGERNRRSEAARAVEDGALQQAVALLELIPDSPENNPKKMQLLTSMLNQKSQKSWRDIFNPEADHTYQARLLSQLTGMIPSTAEHAQQQGQAPATRPRRVADQSPDYIPASQKFEFPDEGQFYPLGVIADPDTGERFAQLYDRKTGEVIEKPVRRGVTEKESVAKIRAQAAGQRGTEGNKKLRDLAVELAARDQKVFAELTPDEQDEYVFQAGSIRARQAEAQTTYQELRPDIGRAVIDEKRGNLGRGGVSGAQDIATQQRRQDTKMRLEADVARADADVVAAQSEIAALKNSPDIVNARENAKKKGTPLTKAQEDSLLLPDEQTALRKAEAKLAHAQQTKAAALKALNEFVKSPELKPRGGASGSDRPPLTGNLNVDRIYRNQPTADPTAPQSPDASRAPVYNVDPTQAVVIDGATYDYPQLKEPDGTALARRVAGQVYVLNPDALPVAINALQPGQELTVDDPSTTKKGLMAFRVMRVLRDPTRRGRAKVVAQKIR